MKILAIDSGVERTGYSVFEKDRYIVSGLIKTSKTYKKEYRLRSIYEDLKKLIARYNPRIVVIEQLFFLRNQKTAISVSQAQGVVLLLAAQNNIAVEFLTPLQIKQTITGYGQADKRSVQKMLKLTLGLSIKQDDEADAVACGLAYCYLNKNQLK